MSYDWEYLSENFDTISDNLIAKNNLLKLNLHILAQDYLENRPSCFTEVIKDKDKNDKE